MQTGEYKAILAVEQQGTCISLELFEHGDLELRFNVKTLGRLAIQYKEDGAQVVTCLDSVVLSSQCFSFALGDIFGPVPGIAILAKHFYRTGQKRTDGAVVVDDGVIVGNMASLIIDNVDTTEAQDMREYCKEKGFWWAR